VWDVSHVQCLHVDKLRGWPFEQGQRSVATNRVLVTALGNAAGARHAEQRPLPSLANPSAHASRAPHVPSPWLRCKPLHRVASMSSPAPNRPSATAASMACWLSAFVVVGSVESVQPTKRERERVQGLCPRDQHACCSPPGKRAIGTSLERPSTYIRARVARIAPRGQSIANQRRHHRQIRGRCCMSVSPGCPRPSCPPLPGPLEELERVFPALLPHPALSWRRGKY
jgi:hypothetical protein